MQTLGQAVKNDAGQVVLVVIAVAVSVVVVCAQLIVGIERKAQARLQGQGMNLCALVEQGTGVAVAPGRARRGRKVPVDRKSTRLNSSHVAISYAVFCLKKKKKINSHQESE